MISIIIADDHPIIREGIKKILETTHGMRVDKEVNSGEELIEHLLHNDYDVLLLDISLPGRSGIDLIHDIKRMAPSMAILILSMHEEKQYAVRSLKEGANGYITKDKAPTELISAIHKVSNGGKYISSELAEQIAFRIADHGVSAPHERLSSREFQVLILIAKGRTIGDIAHTLSLSVSTISTYHHRIFEKLEISSNAELIQYAIKHNLTE